MQAERLFIQPWKPEHAELPGLRLDLCIQDKGSGSIVLLDIRHHAHSFWELSLGSWTHCRRSDIAHAGGHRILAIHALSAGRELGLLFPAIVYDRERDRADR